MSSKAKKKRQQSRTHRFVTPKAFLRQKALEGDFPVQIRPTAIPETRDLQDPALDELAVKDLSAKKPLPHQVREAVARQFPTSKIRGLTGDKGKLEPPQAAAPQATEIPKFDLEKDISEEHAADMAARRARALARRKFRWMPNPMGTNPGPLAPDPKSEKKYFDRYFDGKRLAQDQRRPGAHGDEEMKSPGRLRTKRNILSPREFWYNREHVTPTPEVVPLMRARELKFSMVNEAHLVRIWREKQPDKAAAGLPPGSQELWMAFGYRAAELSLGRALLPRESDAARAMQGAKPPRVACGIHSTLRYLQCLASVQAGPYSAIQQLVHVAMLKAKELRPRQCFYLFQALSRLRLKHARSVVLLERMSLLWKTLRDKDFIKAANAVAKLDLAGNSWSQALKLALFDILQQLSGSHLANLKSIAVMELLDTSEGLERYLEACLEHRDKFRNSRHLRMVELYVHLLYPTLYQQLDEEVKLFLQDVRTVAEKTQAPEKTRTTGRRHRRRVVETGSDGSEDESATSSDSDSEEPQSRGYDERKYSSILHADISRVLHSELRVDHQNRLAAGPLSVDVFHMQSNTVVEAGERWQYYVRSSQVTSHVRRRHELLRAMGFQLVVVPFHRWATLNGDGEKADYLRKSLPKSMLSFASIERLEATAQQPEQTQP